MLIGKHNLFRKDNTLTIRDNHIKILQLKVYWKVHRVMVALGIHCSNYHIFVAIH